MDMEIDFDLVKAERLKRAWSQDQLAAATGLGLRTIQRVEASGLASNETVKSLAAVFQRDVQDLMLARTFTPDPSLWSRISRHRVAIGTAAVALLSATLLVARASAGEVMLDVVMGGKDLQIKAFKLLTEEGKQAEARVEQQIRVVLTPTLQDGDLILVSAQIYQYDGTDYRLVSSPKVLARNGQGTQLQIGLREGKDVQMSITPKKL